MKDTDIISSCGNIFADLGFDNPEGMLLQAQLLYQKEKETGIPCRFGWEEAFIEFKDINENEIIIPDVFEEEILRLLLMLKLIELEKFLIKKELKYVL